MSGSLSGKVAIITGGSKGIGAATARRFLSEGAKVMINYSSDTATASSFIASLDSPNVSSIQADAGSISGISTIISATLSTFGRIDIVIANAALLLLRDLASTTPEDFTRMFTVNVQGPYFLAQQAAPHMSEGGRLVFLSSSVAKTSTIMPNYLLYSATKGAVEQMTRIMARDLGKKGITVNAIAPGPTDTELFNEGKSEETLKMIRGWHPKGRIGTPDEVAGSILMVVREDAAWVNGQIIYVNGGSTV